MAPAARGPGDAVPHRGPADDHGDAPHGPPHELTPRPRATRRHGEYAVRGDYHRAPSRRWTYYPVYVEKLRLVERWLGELPRTARIVDLGCGEGILVEKLRHQGYQAVGIDQDYGSEHVLCRDLLETQLSDGSVDVVVCLDVLEHLAYVDQPRALREIARILAPGGRLILSIPNLGHFSSRLVFALTGRLLRTSSPERHPGDRTYQEFRRVLEEQFVVRRVRGIFPTFPLSGLLTLAWPAAMLPWHRVLNRWLAVPSWCFLNVFECTPRPAK